MKRNTFEMLAYVLPFIIALLFSCKGENKDEYIEVPDHIKREIESAAKRQPDTSKWVLREQGITFYTQEGAIESDGSNLYFTTKNYCGEGWVRLRIGQTEEIKSIMRHFSGKDSLRHNK